MAFGGASYAAADLTAQSVAGWVPPLLSADGEWLGERDLSVARIRDLIRNDGWAQAAVDRQVDMTVGATFRLNAKPDAVSLGIGQDEADAFALRIEAKWRKFAEDPTFRADAERDLPVAGLIGLAARELVSVGEAVGLLRWIPRRGWPFATALQMVDADRLSNPYGVADDDELRGGVEYDRDNAAVAYHFRDGHPSDWYVGAKAHHWTRIERFERVGDWDRPKVLHLKEKRRPGQGRGVSRLVSALVKQRLLAKYSESEVKAAALNGSVVGAIYTQMGAEYAAEALGQTPGGDGVDWGAFNDARRQFYGDRRVLDEARFVTVADREPGEAIYFEIPHFPHMDYITPKDLQDMVTVLGRAGVRPRTLDDEMVKRLFTIMNKHKITREYVRSGALKGLIKDGRGRVLYDLYQAFGITKKVVDFELDDANTDVNAKCDEVLGHMQDNIRGETMTGAEAIVSPEFFNKLVGHPNVEKYWLQTQFAGQLAATERQRLGGQWGRLFEHQTLLFREYRGSAPIKSPAGGVTNERFVAANKGHAYPTGTQSAFATYDAPPHDVRYANLPGIEVSISPKVLDHGAGVELQSQSNPLALCRRPEVLVEVTTD
ncbi:major capsid protein [Methylopila musalis]|uniref:Major capsid protein n=1 Tax=Methylopila musalis TaxID=1134781 RepID=A0ABW3Z384_9HYPH